MKSIVILSLFSLISCERKENNFTWRICKMGLTWQMKGHYSPVSHHASKTECVDAIKQTKESGYHCKPIAADCLMWKEFNDIKIIY